MESIALYLLMTTLAWMHSVNSEVYTAIVDLEPLLDTHKRIIDDLDFYIQQEEKRIQFLKKKLVLYKNEHEKAMEDIPNYLGNPLNAFTLIKRLTTDLDRIEQSIKIGTEYIKNVTMTQKGIKYPTEEDLNGAASALIRLQETYKLEPAQLAEGVINGITYSYPLTASDCFQLGKIIYTSGDYSNAQRWMKEALNKIESETNDSLNYLEKADIVEYIGFSYYLQGNIEEALVWTRELIKLDPDHPRAIGNIPLYEKALEEKQRLERRRKRGETDPSLEEEQVIPETKNKPERNNYEALCRGEIELPPSVTKNLICRYSSDHHVFLKIAPFKVEEMYKEPDVYVFHDVLSYAEIEYIKSMARPRFRRATVHNPETGELVPAAYRISKSAWLKDNESPVVAKVSQRASDFTGLSVASAEELQVVNYGIGGHYEPHFDFARQTEKHAFNAQEGNRIATVLFYMSDVAQGGATVFTELGLAVRPEKGAALVWRNLLPSGVGDYSTRHAACPVLAGSKWVCNKWVHEGGQEFRAPCSLELQQEGEVRPLPSPVPAYSSR